MNNVSEKNKKSWDDYSETYLGFNHSEKILSPILENPEKAFHSQLFPELKAALGDFRGKKICVPSSGDNLAVFAFAMLGAEVTSADISEKQLEGSKKCAEKLGLQDRITFVQADTKELSGIPSDEFDFVYTSNGVHVWIDDLDSMYRNIFRILKKGGKYAMYDVHPFQRPFDEMLRVRKPYTDVGPFEDEWNITFDWRVSDILNAIIKSGLCVRGIQELSAEKDYERPFFISHEEIVNGLVVDPEDVDQMYDYRCNPQMALPHWLSITAEK